MTVTTNKHNKKRNVGLLWEFLVRDVTRSIVEETSRGEAALRVLKKYFKPGTALYEEFLLFKALIRTTVGPGIATSLIAEAKRVAKRHDLDRLESEKTAIIHEINKSVSRGDFWDQQIPDYKRYATVQTLINDWRSDSGSIIIERMMKYEEQVAKWLLEEKVELTLEDSGRPDGVEQLAVHLMTKKLNERWSGVLSDDQKQIIKLFIFSEGRGTEIRELLTKIRSETLTQIDSNLKSMSKNDYNSTPLREIREKIIGESIQAINDDVVAKFMSITRLRDELRAGDEK